MQKFVQKIDFILGLKDVLKMLSESEGTTGLKITFGITEDAEIVLSSEGVIWNGRDMVVTSEPVKPCPVPPDCPKNIDCIAKLNQQMPLTIIISKFLDIQNTKVLLSQ